MRGTTRKNSPKRSRKKRQKYRENRHKYNQLSAWVALTVFSVISVVSLSTSQDKRYWNSDLRYSLAMASMSLIVGTTASAFHLLCLMGNTFSRQSLMEVFLSVSAMVVWIVCLPTIHSPQNGLAIKDMFIVNANLYCSTWGAFVLSVYHVLNVLGTEKVLKISTDEILYMKKWLWLLVSSMVALSSASEMIRNAQCTKKRSDLIEGDYCDDLKIGLWLSIFATATTLFVSVLSVTLGIRHRPSFLVPIEFFLATCLSILWSICIAFLTFGKGPASYIGNLFFSVWISLILSVDLVVFHVKQFVAKGENDEGRNEQANSTRIDHDEITENPTEREVAEPDVENTAV